MCSSSAVYTYALYNIIYIYIHIIIYIYIIAHIHILLYIYSLYIYSLYRYIIVYIYIYIHIYTYVYGDISYLMMVGWWWDNRFQVLQVSWYESVVSLAHPAHPLEPAYCGMICWFDETFWCLSSQGMVTMFLILTHSSTQMFRSKRSARWRSWSLVLNRVQRVADDYLVLSRAEL